MDTRSKQDISGFDFSHFTMPSPHSRRKGKGSGSSHQPAATMGRPCTPVSSPKFTITYNLATVSDILMVAGLEIPLEEEDEDANLADRMSALIMEHVQLPEQWISAYVERCQDLLSTSKCTGLKNHVQRTGTTITYHT